MLYNYESELSFWGPEEHEGMYIHYDSVDEMMKRYTELLAHLEELRLNEPPRKHNLKSKEEYEIWVRRTHDDLDELNELAEAIREKQLSR